MNRFGITKERCSKAFKHLEEVGLIERKQTQGEGGKLTGSKVIVHYTPVTEGLENRTVGEPDGRENQPHSNVLSVSNVLSSSNNSKPADAGDDSGRGDQVERKATKTNQRDQFIDRLINRGVDAEIAEEWANIRKTKRLTLTTNSISILEREAKKAGIDMPTAVENCVLRGWGGFKADWLANDQSLRTGQNRAVTESSAKLKPFPMG